MDFFEYQQHAKTKTVQLVIMLIMSIVSLVLICNLTFAAIWPQYFIDTSYLQSLPRENFNHWVYAFYLRFRDNPTPHLLVNGLIISVILMASLFEYFSLRKMGPRTIAQQLNGYEIKSPENILEKRLVNIVEEIAIAAAVPRPAIFVIPENSINAFAAGFGPQDALIAVTKGCLEKLTRDELQAVIAHEFSHIVHNDVNINMQLIGLTHGLLIIFIAGRVLLEGLATSLNRKSSSRKSNSSGNQIIILAIFLMIIGYLGYLCSLLIKAAVSRQREYLADATAVQYTRHPIGLANALKKIYFNAGQGIIRSPRAAYFCHMFFASGIKKQFLSILATHPPLEERIKRFDPQFNPDDIETRDKILNSIKTNKLSSENQNTTIQNKMSLSDAANQTLYRDKDQAIEQIINAAATIPQPAMQEALILSANIPDCFRQNLYDPFGAVCVIFAISLVKDPQKCRAQLEIIEKNFSGTIAEKSFQLFCELPHERLAALRLALLDLAMPALEGLSMQQLNQFAQTLRSLVTVDGEIDLFEFAMFKILMRHFHPHKFREHFQMSWPKAVSIVLYFLAQHSGQANALELYQKAIDKYQIYKAYVNHDIDISNLKLLDLALNKLTGLRPLYKKRFIQACAYCIFNDQQINDDELYLFRAISAALDVPMPIEFEIST